MIIAISEKIGSGKDTVGRIIQYLTSGKINRNNFTFQRFLEEQDILRCLPSITSEWKIKKFADKLKDIVCLLIGCTKEQLEDQKFKETELGEEWNKYEVGMSIDLNIINYQLKENQQFGLKREDGLTDVITTVKLTPRLLLQLIGTECGRDILHPNLWVNTLMSEYKTCEHKCLKAGSSYCGDNKYDCTEVPNWIITDMRFPNELKAVKDRGGISIRIIRRTNQGISNHFSETVLDEAIFDYTIYNDSTIEELIEKVKEILIKEKIIQ